MNGSRDSKAECSPENNIYNNRTILTIAVVIGSIPLLRTIGFFHSFYGPYLLRSWDGSAHLAALSIYDRSIFPDTFGWTNAWFAGMPLPNYYPPLLYWVAAALHHLGLPLILSFKLTVGVPFLIVPACLGFLAWLLSSRDILVAACTTIVACLPLVDAHLQSNFPGGLTYVSTFNEGLCSQPLGFVLLTVWITMYLGTLMSWRSVTLASFFLSLLILGNFFSAVSALPFAIVGLAYGGFRSKSDDLSAGESKSLIRRFLVLACGAALCAFWTVPVIAEYSYFATRPLQVPWSEMLPRGPYIWIWFGVAIAGAASMILRGNRSARSYITGCFVLVPLSFPFTSRLHWTPSQPARQFSTLTFLCAVPVGWLLAMALSKLVKTIPRIKHQQAVWTAGTVVITALLVSYFVKLAPLGEALYITDSPIAAVLDFARTHHDGRYIVENSWQHGNQHDSRSLNAYLGMQGNETLNIAFHEAASDSVFLTPLVNALSASVDSFGISAALANDLDFYNQSPERHLARAKETGVRYLVCSTPFIKNRFRQQPDLIEHDLGKWSIFEFKAAPEPNVQMLKYLPALVVSPIDFKERKSDSASYTRFSEEQFNSNRRDVLLAHALTNNIDELSDLQNFGALILATYDCLDQDAAYEKVRRFAQSRLVVLISSDQPLYDRLKNNLSELPNAVTVARTVEINADRFNQSLPWLNLDQSNFRKEWNFIGSRLDEKKISVADTCDSRATVSASSASTIHISCTRHANLPVLLRSSFHPNWVRTDGQPMYAISPFFILTFANDSFDLRFRRTRFEFAALWISALAFLALLAAGLGTVETIKRAISGVRIPFQRVTSSHVSQS